MDSKTHQQSRFRNNILRIATGSLASQVIIIGATPFLTRLYGPEEFGALAIFTAGYAIFVGLLTLKYDLAIVLPCEKCKAIDLTVLTLSISLVLSLFLLIVICVSHFGFTLPMHWYIFLLPLSTLLGAVYTCAQQWCARASDYRPYAYSQVLNSLVNVCASVLLGAYTTKLFGSLVLGFVAGLIFGILYFLVRYWREVRGNLSFKFNLTKVVGTAIKYKQFPMYVLPAAVLASLSMNATPFLFQAMFSLQAVGFYAIANRFLMAPSSLVGGAVAEAFRAEFVARQKRNMQNATFFRSTLYKLVLFALPVFAFFFYIAPTLFAFAFGESYRAAGALSRYLCIGVFAQFVSQPFHYIFVATGHVKLGLIMQSAATVMPLLAIVLVGWGGDMEQAVLIAGLLNFVLSAILVSLAYHGCKVSDSTITAQTHD